MVTCPRPPQAVSGKARVIAGERLPADLTHAAVSPAPSAHRVFYCRTCGEERASDYVPTGWLSVQRHTGEHARPLRLGVFCSAACLEAQLPRLAGIERDLGDRWLTSPYLQATR